MRSLFLLPLACAAALLTSTPARAEVSRFNVRVETKNSIDRGQKGDDSQTRTLNIFVTSSAKEAVDLKVKYRVIGRNLGNHDLVAVGEGEMPVNVKPGATEKVDAPTARASSNDGKGSGGKNAKKVDPTGSKIIGHGVQVLQGDKIVAEVYEPGNLKEQFGKIPAAAAPAK